MTCGGRSWAGPERGSEILCVLTHGMGSTPPAWKVSARVLHDIRPCYRRNNIHPDIDMKDNGKCLLECYMTYDLVIGGTIYTQTSTRNVSARVPHDIRPCHRRDNIHPDIDKLTWCSRNGRDKNHREYVIIKGTWKEPFKTSSLQLHESDSGEMGQENHNSSSMRRKCVTP